MSGALTACGGGGGGSGSPAADAPPVAEIRLSVEIDGVAATPDASGRYNVRPGQSVRVSSSEAASWQGNSLGSGVTRTDVDTGDSQWVSRFDNPGASAAGSYQLNASTSDGRTKAVDFRVQTGDYRNGEYTVFAGNGTRQTLRIDFEAATYSMTDGAGITVSGTLTPPVAPAREWTFQSSRIGGVNTSTLRDLRDSIVGAFPFDTPFAGAGTYAARPFIATRALVLNQRQLDGAYDRAGITQTPGGTRQSDISQMGISGGGTVLKICNDTGIYRIANCPPASVVTSRVEADAVPGIWQVRNPDTGALIGRIGVAMVDGEKIYLTAGVAPSDGSQVLRIGVPANKAASTFTSAGWSTLGTRDVGSVDPTVYDLTLDDGVATVHNLTRAGGTGSPGIHVYSEPGQTYFSLRSQRLALLIGARSSVRAGFLHLGVVD